MIPALRLIALDLSLSATGLAATHDHRGRPGLLARTIHTARSVPAGIDHRRIRTVLTDVAAAAKCQPHLVVIEWLPAFDGKGDTSLRLAELHGVITQWLFGKGIPYAYVKPTYLQMYATGKGRATKEAVRAAVTATYGRLVHIEDADQADAVALLALGLDAYGQALAPVSALQARAVSSVTWPDITMDPLPAGVTQTPPAGGASQEGTR